MESDKKINFLDLTIIRKNNCLITDWYQKPTSSGRLLNFLSNHPLNQKRNIVFNLTDRAISLSHKSFHKKNIDLIKQLLKNNNYPTNFVNDCISKRLNCIKHKKKSNNDKAVREFRKTLYAKKPKIVIPFKNKKFYSKCNYSLKEHEISTIPKVTKSLKNFVKLGKDPTKKWDKNGVVYKISCKDCNAVYYGETKRTFETRIKEHAKNKKVNQVILEHCLKYQHEFDFDNAIIVDVEQDWKRRTLSEMLFINHDSNSINKKENINNLSNTYKKLLHKIII